MKYFDQLRPRICNRPAYVYQGRAIAPLPTLMIEPNPEGGHTITIMIVREDRGGSWHHREVPSFLELQLLLSLWEYDPEAVLFDFGWEYHDERQRGSVQEEAHYLRLEDLEEEDEAPVGATRLDLSDLD